MMIGYEIIPTSDRISPVFRFKNLHHLDVHLPFDENLILIAPELDQLISLQVSTHRLDYEFDAQKQLQALLNRAPHLTSLIFKYWSLPWSEQKPPYDCFNKSIRQLGLQDIDQEYNSRDCMQLCHSSIGKQCQVLAIAVENRHNILELIEGMSNLRTLNVVCRDDIWRMKNENKISSSSNDELIDWLQQSLSSICTIIRHDELIKDSKQNCFQPIHLWF
ncbi:unnamed protein product [Adineta ricciae]|uniref:Uncharacterized protein n=1 Tax=Adineta ricciae TaxID=249248 RepID=A0A816GDN9_ADIRI|nr:unnamed protein product [Adineta ricciae]